MIEKRLNKEVTYESILTLTKVRNLTEMQIFTEKSSIEKREIFEELSC